ncbi:MAG TPA: serine/threonine-protein kinase [Myxococcota bacterium]|nr:serine/threonine-protein kinase [Myxococcota bacterium]
MAKQYTLGKYELIKRIAVGGMSEIYLASQGGLEGFERAVIVKCIREDLDTENEVKEMFIDEARIAACLKHPNIVHLYDVGRDGDTAYLAMEYIFGRDMMSICDRARFLGRELPVQVLAKIMCDVLAGLHYAHVVAEFEDRPLHVIHRDVSPQNILLSFDGITKLVDFGIAKATARLSETRAGILKGKYAYMSPEQVRGKPLDHRSDQFSLAVVLYEALTHTRLFQRDTDYSTMEAVDRCEIPPIKVLRKDIPRRLLRVLRKAMRRNPKRRFSSAKEMERSLHKLLRGSGVEQTERVSDFVRGLFSTELHARDRAIQGSSGDERDLILSTGFEMISEKGTLVRAAPEPPLAVQRYEEILSERQAAATEIKAKLLGTRANVQVRGTKSGSDEGDENTDQHGSSVAASEESTVTGKRYSNLLNDWRFLVLIFAAVMVVALFILLSFGGQRKIDVPLPDMGQPQSMHTSARPGVDGSLSVSVNPRVTVTIDGESMGKGAFQRHPLEMGLHKVKLTDQPSGKTREIMVNIKADKNFLLSPMDYQ